MPLHSFPSNAHLQHVEQQWPELGPLYHEERHLVTEFCGRCCKAPVWHSRGVDGADHLSQSLLRASRVLRLLHERGQLLLHPTAVAPHVVEKIYEPVHVLWSRPWLLNTCLFLRWQTGREERIFILIIGLKTCFLSSSKSVCAGFYIAGVIKSKVLSCVTFNWYILEIMIV